MSIFQTVLSTIDLRSFSNAWYWIMLIVAWSSMTSHLLGVPFDMVLRARREGGQAMIDLETLAHVQARRRMAVIAQSGPVLVAFWLGLITMAMVLGLVYRLELGLALSLLLIPLAIAVMMGLPLTRRIADGTLGGEDLTKALTWHRFWLMLLGLFAIMITTLIGMIWNLVTPTLGF